MGKHSTTLETEGRSRACPFLASGTPGLISESENTPFRPLAEESKTNPDLKPTVGLGNYARPVAPLSPPALPQHGEARLPVSAPPSRCGKERAADGGRRTQRAHPAAGPGRAVTAAALLPPPRRPQPRQRLLRQRHRQRPFPFPAGIAPRRAAPPPKRAPLLRVAAYRAPSLTRPSPRLHGLSPQPTCATAGGGRAAPDDCVGRASPHRPPRPHSGTRPGRRRGGGEATGAILAAGTAAGWTYPAGRVTVVGYRRRPYGRRTAVAERRGSPTGRAARVARQILTSQEALPGCAGSVFALEGIGVPQGLSVSHA